MHSQRRGVPANRLNKVASASRWEPPLRLGDIVRLNSGGRPMQVVDALPGSVMVTVAFKIKNEKGVVVVKEWDIVRAAVHRIRDLW